MAGGLRGASLQGSVSEQRSGKPLARAKVEVRAEGGTLRSVMADRSGRFLFTNLPGGSYELSATRLGYAPAKYGQAQGEGPATPIVLGSDSTFLADLRLQRFGSIAGEIVDENQVGLPQVTVQAVRLGLRQRIANQTSTDDRGQFRLAGLPPGRYAVRTAAREEEGRGFLPTYLGQVTHAEAAQPLSIELDLEVAGVRIEPLAGRVSSISGSVAPWVEGVPVAVTLLSGAGPLRMNAGPQGAFQFPAVTPGEYTVMAEGTVQGEPHSAWQRITVGEQPASVSLALQPSPSVAVRCDVEAANNPRGISVFFRPQSEMEGETPLRATCGETIRLSPGVWELGAAAPPQLYLASAAPTRIAADALLVQIEPRQRLALHLRFSSQAAALEGSVHNTDNTPAIGAPVFVRSPDPDVASRMGGFRMVRTGQQGEFQLEGLPPGAYDLLSSFRFRTPGEVVWQESAITRVQVKAGERSKLALGLKTGS